MKPYLAKATRSGVVAIGVPQEFQKVFTPYDRAKDNPRLVSYAFEKADRRVSVYYFYVWDDDFGPSFIKDLFADDAMKASCHLRLHRAPTAREAAQPCPHPCGCSALVDPKNVNRSTYPPQVGGTVTARQPTGMASFR